MISLAWMEMERGSIMPFVQFCTSMSIFLPPEVVEWDPNFGTVTSF